MRQIQKYIGIKKSMIAGVVAEFNPFHLGHKYLIDNIPEKYLKIAIISSNIVQRADVSILTLESRTKLAIENGIDLVVQLPDKYSYQNAEVFCTKSTQLLKRLNIDTQFFGAENDDILEISKMKDILNNSDIKQYLKKGFSYNKSSSIILKDMYKPNNILAMEYINANNKYCLGLEQKIIKRNNEFMSATRTRQLIESGDKNIPYYDKYEFNPECNEKIFSLFKYIYLTNDSKNIYDMTDQINNFIYHNIKKSYNYNEFINNCSKKNISIKRIKRIMFNVILNITVDDIKLDMTDEKIKILAMNEKGQNHLKNIDNYCVNYKYIYEDEKKFINLYDYLGLKQYLKNVIITKGG